MGTDYPLCAPGNGLHPYVRACVRARLLHLIPIHTIGLLLVSSTRKDAKNHDSPLQVRLDHAVSALCAASHTCTISFPSNL